MEKIEKTKIHNIVFKDGTIYKTTNEFLEYLIRSERNRQKLQKEIGIALL